jgi:2-iminobutanoate/2-iminopropanoate deaminase
MDVIRTQNAPKPPAYFSQAVKSGGFVFVAGQGPFDPASAALFTAMTSPSM